MKKTLLTLFSLSLMLCFSTGLNAQTAGTLTFTYNQPQPTSPTLNEGIKNVYAVWIESSTGTFIKTKCRYTSTSTDDHLPTWASKSGCTNTTVATGSACNVTDAVTGATRTTSSTPTAFGAKSITWDGKNVVGTTNGTTVADGTYKVWVESSWHNGTANIHNEINSFTFTKSSVATHATYTGDTYLNTIVIDWVPTPLGVEDVKDAAPAVIIYPVPSSGVFNIDVKNQVKDIAVYNLLGQIIYSEKHTELAVETTKQIDLSHFSNGSYILSLTNDIGTSNYEIVIQK